MLFHLFYGALGDKIGWLRVFRYTSTRILAAAITALLLSFILGPWFIEQLKARQIGETIRTDGPQTHKKKAGTPTMGGSLILFCLAVSTLLWCDLRNQFVWLALTVTVAFGAIGFADDYIKVAKQNKKGLSGKLRLVLEFAIAGGAMAYLFYSNAMAPDVRLHLQLPFTNFYEHGPRAAGVAVRRSFGAFVVVGTANAVNFTDGLDGLAIGPSIMNAGTFLVFAYIAGVQTTLVVERPRGHDRAVPARRAHRRRRGARGVLRRAVRHRHRLPLVQHVPRAGVHGRRRRRCRSAARSACSRC